MKLNEIIRERRIAKQLTQEQLAGYLGVTAPAVNKWEKGVSYPDITLLPILARLLGTDLNTFLSFQDDLSEKEIALFLNSLSESLASDGFEKVFELAMDKIKEFPTCYALILNTAMFLDGALTIQPKAENTANYKNEVEGLYQRALNSNDENIRNRAKSVLISMYRERKEYEAAQELLQTLPEKSPVDKKQIQASLYMTMGKLEEAAKIEEEKLLSLTNEMQQTLMLLMEIALKQNRTEDAEYIADVSKKCAEIFDLWEYNRYAAEFQLYAAQKNPAKSVQALVPMLKALTHKWDINKSPLYRHIKSKKEDAAFGTRMRKILIDSICTEDDTVFLKDNKIFQAAISEFDGQD